MINVITLVKPIFNQTTDTYERAMSQSPVLAHICKSNCSSSCRGNNNRRNCIYYIIRVFTKFSLRGELDRQCWYWVIYHSVIYSGNLTGNKNAAFRAIILLPNYSMLVDYLPNATAAISSLSLMFCIKTGKMHAKLIFYNSHIFTNLTWT